uniref:Uncharacterized protein n=1 Tax=Anguilla anguilla TaxID=7936 RepID=A0A0E9R682_ANGAN
MFKYTYKSYTFVTFIVMPHKFFALNYFAQYYASLL